MRSFSIFIFSLLFALTAAAQNENTHIKIASFNIRLDTEQDGINAWSKRKENVKALIRYHDLEIVGVQEAFHNQLLVLTEMPEFAYFGAGRDDGKSGGEHSAILYRKDRFSIVRSGNFWLSETPDVPGKGWDATCCNRICSWAEFKDKRSGKRFYIFNTHFDHQGVEARRESGKLMVRKIKEIAKDTPVICTGDFNSTPDTEQIRALSSLLNDSYNVSKQAPYGPVGTFNSFVFTAPLKDRIDYVFVSRHFEVLKYAVLTDARDQRYPSDHLPVVADIRLK